MPAYHKVTPCISSGFPNNLPVPVSVKRGTVGVKCFAQECNTMTLPGLELGPCKPESSALTLYSLYISMHILHTTL